MELDEKTQRILALRAELDRHTFDGYDGDQVWATCTCGEQYLDTNAHVAEIMTAWNTEWEQQLVSRATKSMITLDQAESREAAFAHEIMKLREATGAAGDRYRELERKNREITARLDRAIGSCSAALVGGAWSNAQWVRGVRSILDELKGDADTGKSPRAAWPRLQSGPAPWYADKGGDKWKARGRKG